MNQRLLNTRQQCRAAQRHPRSLELRHVFAVGGVDQLHTLIAHVPELPDKRLHVAVFRLGEDVVDGKGAARKQFMFTQIKGKLSILYIKLKSFCN